MAHWHDFNPWAGVLLYLPSLAELLSPYEEAKLLKRFPGKLDLYMLHEVCGLHSVGLRYGAREEEYVSLFLAPAKSTALWAKYSNSGAP